MCGIYAHVSRTGLGQISADLERRLRNRGPDHLGTVQVTLEQHRGPLFITLTSTVLSLRGDHVTKQPLVDGASGSVLCWNGEAWRIRGDAVQGNDGEAVLSLLVESSASNSGETGVLDALRMIEGPFAFVFFDKPTKRLYYGRDRLGRRSLLIRGGESLSFSSVADSDASWAEVEADGCYELYLGEESKALNEAVTRHDWINDERLVSSLGVFNMETDRGTSGGEPLHRDSPSVQQLLQYLDMSLRPRVLDVPLPPHASPSDARIAILFSGGLDCTVLARLSSMIIPADQFIDLINVAFENPRIASQHKGSPDVNLYELCPDRVTGRKAFEELTVACPDRLWRFVTVDVPYSVTCEHRNEVVRLLHPHNTEMDLSIATALYFAARGQGVGQTSPESQAVPYATTSRVLISGLGADELFGGYGRHAVAFSQQGYPGLVDALKLDVSRLGKRNLGRDDRVMAHWGREVRFPYLDEHLVKWAMELPAWEKCDYDRPDATEVEPGKRVLRLLAGQLGLKSVSREKKRAIQFGARTAKMESGKVKGTTLISA
ncbi:asparagine synthase-like protein [Stachybotrys elegans]|uniref:Asparagine synthase-like protein n=1 Tax=Stachybotrys elegans TaxID=80388 RepID=A0A8K0T1D3_9HYPO|nr:asparagine synthase-like protein [Stachybotrys elegans]